MATDDQGARTISAEVPIVVYDAVGTPVAQIISPLDGAIMEGPTNLLFTATANGTNGVARVEFLANGVPFGTDATSPYTALWPSIFLGNSFVAIVTDANGARGTSAVVNLFITIPPTNVIAPTIATQNPLAGSNLTNTFTSLAITFSEVVQNVDAGDLLVNGVPATGVSAGAGGSNYVFTFPRPPYGSVAITWASGHGITDYGFPSTLPFDELAPSAHWQYQLVDRLAPTIAARTPAAGTTVTNLAQISVTFSEAVSGVDAADLLVNGAPALGLSGSGSNYLFNVVQPASGTIAITWATNHGIADLAELPNAFNGTNTNARWSFTLDTRTVLVQTNSTWKLLKGLAEASAPTDAWRQPGFDDSTWSNSLAPFVFGEPTFTNALNPGTDLGDMTNNAYSSIYLRQPFVVANAGTVTNLLLSHRSDDGFIAWINGIEVFRYNMPAGQVPYNGGALTAATESAGNSGVPFINVTLSNAALAVVSGTNLLAVHAFNVVTTPSSSDFVFNAQLYTYLLDASTSPPRLAQPAPPPGDVFYLTNITVNFSEGVSGVEAADFLINGVPADTVSSPTNSTYTFSFAQPPYGPVFITWATNHGIVDFDNPPKPLDGEAANSKFGYTLINPSNPKITAQFPLASATVTGLTSIVVIFTEPVTGVDASDLLISGTPASGVASSDNIAYVFSFAQPPFGTVAIRWATNHGITDVEVPPNSFDPTRFGGQWNYTLIDPVPSVTLTSPPNNTFLLPPATATLRATATDNDGSIALVAFYNGANKLGEATNAPYSLTVSNLPLGTYVFRAVATDNIGLMGTSAPVVLNVVTSLPIVLVRGPYLQIGTPTSGVVRWRTDAISDALVYYGTDLAHLTNVAVQASVTNEHIVQVSGLQADTKYFYSIGSAAYRLVGGTNDGANYWFKTSPAPGSRGPVRFWALGDSGTAGNGSPDRVNSVRNAFYNFAATNGPADFWLMLGDNAYNSGQDTEYQAAVFNIFPTMLRNRWLWPTLGNHESGQSTTSTDFPYLNIFSLPHNGEAGGVASGTQKYYSFDYANVHFLCLDSMTSGYTTNTPMFQWMQDDLAATTAEWVIVFFHHPPYTHGTHNSDIESDLIQIRQNFVPVLEAYGVDLVLNGHSHVHERSYLLDGHYGVASTFTESMKVDGGDGRKDGTGAYRKNAEGRGVVYNVCGCSGQALGGTLDHPAHYLSLNELGSLVVDVNQNRLDVRFLTTNGDFSDHYTLIKQRLPESPADLIARALGPNDVALTWTDLATNELGFIIERSTDGASFAAFATNSVNATNLIDSGLLANTTYFYRVRAFNDGGESDPSNIAGVTTVITFSPPAAPTGLSVSAGNGSEAYRSQIFLRWTDRSANEAGFLIERSDDGATFSPVGTVAAGLTRYTDHHLASATTYYYRVRSFNLWGQSAPSNLDGDQTHPQDAFVSAGESATFTAGVEGTVPIRYQWRFMGLDISGATNQTLTLTNAQPADEGAYTVAITDASGATLSNPALLFVFAPPVIVNQPASRTNVIGSAATFHVDAIGSSPLFYQWRKNGNTLPGAAAEQFAIAAVTTADQGNYDVLVINDLGAVTSQVARLVVHFAPVAVADRVQGFHDQSLTVEATLLLANDFDLDGDLLFITAVDATSSHGGTLALSASQVTYSPPAGFSGDDTFTYALTDARGATSFGLVTVSVSANNAPVVTAMPDLVADILTPLVLGDFATDPDLPPNQLSYSLAPGAPTNATIDPNSGIFHWTPTREQASSTNPIVVRVVDDGLPPLSNTVSFTVFVNDYIEATAGSTVMNAGETNSVPIDIFSSAGLLSLECAVQFAAGRLTNVTVEEQAPQLATLALQMSAANTAVITFTATPDHILQGTQHLARLRFRAVPGQTSAFVPLHITSLIGTKAGTSLAPTPLAKDGRVVVVGTQPLLEPILGSSLRQLMIYGRPGATYTIQYSTSLAPVATWTFRASVPMTTNNFRAVNVGTSVPPPVYYRLRQ
ncbi:MAG TPA: Ig-like domain-containing protein [Verrucomicrobiae bacterium]